MFDNKFSKNVKVFAM